MIKFVGLIFGGESHEHEVSKVSAISFLKNIDYSRFTVFPIYIEKNGSWTIYGSVSAPFRGFEDLHIIESFDKKTPPIQYFQDLDIVFPVIHGETGEDGKIQGFFEMLGVPYVGCGVESSVTGMNKILAKEVSHLFDGVSIVPYQVVGREWWNSVWSNGPGKIPALEMDYPVFVKPARAGSSIGIAKVCSEAELPIALIEAFKIDDKVLIEKAIVGKEIEVGVIGNAKNIEVSEAGWIEYQSEFYDYENKYHNDSSKMHIPAPLSEEVKDGIKNWAKSIYRAVECEGYARIDFFVEDDTNNVFFNEINTSPGLTDKSMFPSLFEGSYTFQELLTRIIQQSLK